MTPMQPLTPPQSIDDATVAAFWRDGAVALRGLFGPEWLALIEQGIEATLARPTPYGRVQSTPDDPGFFFTDYYMWRHHAAFEELARRGPGGGIAARLTGSASVHFFYDGLFVKEPGTERASDWHQDQPYYQVDGEKLCVIWIPIDPVDAENALRVVKGSHRWGRWFQPFFFADGKPWQRGESLFEPLPDIDGDPERYEILQWSLDPGDCIAFHPLSLHGSKGNSDISRRRRAISTTWLGDDAVFGERPGEVEPRIVGDHSFRPGDRLTVESVFPKVWPRARDGEGSV